MSVSLCAFRGDSQQSQEASPLQCATPDYKLCAGSASVTLPSASLDAEHSHETVDSSSGISSKTSSSDNLHAACASHKDKPASSLGMFSPIPLFYIHFFAFMCKFISQCEVYRFPLVRDFPSYIECLCVENNFCKNLAFR